MVSGSPPSRSGRESCNTPCEQDVWQSGIVLYKHYATVKHDNTDGPKETTMSVTEIPDGTQRCLQVIRVAAMAEGLAATLVDNSLRGRCVGGPSDLSGCAIGR